jgi:transcriptional regulator with GAF, ATPase, and Fis domain
VQSATRISADSVRRFRLAVVDSSKPKAEYLSTKESCSIGSHPLNDFVLDDPTVSRFHCEIRLTEQGPVLRDLGSRNGTVMDGVQVLAVLLKNGSRLRLGNSTLQFVWGDDLNKLPLSQQAQFGSLVGGSVPMRAAYALLEKAAASSATVLLDGETGTGKGAAAESIHRQSTRRTEPFVVVDCSAIPENLLESELFGHEKGAFTGATERQIGAFEEANGGTVFLDEIGELPTNLQPKLLRVLDNKEIRRIGSTARKEVDVRIIAATNRDLRAEVNAGRFRSDLYFRLAVLRVTLPPLSQRPDDIPRLVEFLLSKTGHRPADLQWLREPEFISKLQSLSWPGNVRELRNYLERCAIFGSAPEAHDTLSVPTSDQEPVDASGPLAPARERAIANFERRYLQALMQSNDWRVGKAAEKAGMDRISLWRLLRRHGIQNPRRSRDG